MLYNGFLRGYLLADLREAAFANGTFGDGAFANGSRGPTWVTYSPATSLPLTTPLSVCSPAFEPSFQVKAALPFGSLTARVGVTVPDLTEKLTFASGSPRPSDPSSTAFSRSPVNRW